MKPAIRHWYRLITAETVSNKDLFLSSDKVMSTHKVAYEGIRPRPHDRTSYDFVPEYEEKNGNVVWDLLQQDQSFGTTILPRTEPLQKFVGSQFKLTVHERLAILCGLNNIKVELKEINNKTKEEEQEKEKSDLVHSTVFVETDKLRLVGRNLVRLQLGLHTVFSTPRHLSSSVSDIQHDLDFFNDDDALVVQFMKRNLLYNTVFPFQGAMKNGPVHSEAKYNELKTKILDKSSVGSFYTMIGLLHAKFDKKAVVDMVNERVVSGRFGLINLKVDAH